MKVIGKQKSVCVGVMCNLVSFQHTVTAAMIYTHISKNSSWTQLRETCNGNDRHITNVLI